jgi:hypothetical protein
MFDLKLARKVNEQTLHDASKYRIIPFHTSHYSCYLIEACIIEDITPDKQRWVPLLNTAVVYSTKNNKYYRNMENAWNRCKKIARKFPEIKMNKLICESGYAAMKYGSIDGPQYIPDYTRIWQTDLKVISQNL